MKTQIATFAGGCFWCTEAIFKRLKGVISVTSGYAGGAGENPTYNQIYSGATGYTESIQIIFDPNIISYETLLDVFFATHDPTTLNRDGANIGTEYRSAIFYHDYKQKKAALEIINKLEKQAKFVNPIVTEVNPFINFYKAEDEHQNYYEKRPSAPYCQIIIDPKIQKLLKNFKKDVREEYKY